MIKALRKLLRSDSTNAGHDGIWVTFTAYATRKHANGRESRSNCRHVIRFDEKGQLYPQTSTLWRPFEPNDTDTMETEISMFDGIRMIQQATLNNQQWRSVEKYGLDSYLREAIVMRDFTRALGRLALVKTVEGRAAA